MKVRACRVLGHARALYNGVVSYGHHLLCHSERSRTKCGEVEESVLFTLFLGDGSFDSLRSLRMTVVVVTGLRRFKQSAKLKFAVFIVTGAFCYRTTNFRNSEIIYCVIGISLL